MSWLWGTATAHRVKVDFGLAGNGGKLVSQWIPYKELADMVKRSAGAAAYIPDMADDSYVCISVECDCESDDHSWLETLVVERMRKEVERRGAAIAHETRKTVVTEDDNKEFQYEIWLDTYTEEPATPAPSSDATEGEPMSASTTAESEGEAKAETPVTPPNPGVTTPPKPVAPPVTGSQWSLFQTVPSANMGPGRAHPIQDALKAKKYKKRTGTYE